MRRSLPRRLSRRLFLVSALTGVPVGTLASAALEPRWVRTKTIRVGDGPPTHRLVHFTDLHYRGGRRALEKLVSHINDLSPDFVCFTGDIIEERKYLAGALDVLAKIKSPIYGVPGNHDYWAEISPDEVEACFVSTGGGWLLDRQLTTTDQRIVVSGASCRSKKTPPMEPVQGKKNILLIHYPAWIKRVPSRFDLTLAGHSHGGQVRLPFYGPIIVPFSVDEFDLGLYETSAGPLYVNPGIGWFFVPLRLNCRPEITVIEM